MRCTVFVAVTLTVCFAYANGHYLRKRQVLQSDVTTSANCPAGWDPSPCSCKDVPSSQTKASVYCNNATTGDQIKAAFAKLNESHAFDSFWMNNAPVTSLPGGVFGKGSFANFFISDTQLGSLDDETFKGSEATAQNFLLERNNFQNFNFKAIQPLQQLRNLELSSDKVTSIPNEAFGEKSFVEVLNFNDNKIASLGENVFSNMPKLRTIDLSRNKLTTLGNFSFSTPAAVNPISLLIGHNEISSVSKYAFKDLKVKTMEMEDNKMESLAEDVFAPLVDSLTENSGYLATLGNPFSCDSSSVRWLLDLTPQKRGHVIGFMCRDGRALQQLEKSS